MKYFYSFFITLLFGMNANAQFDFDKPVAKCITEATITLDSTHVRRIYAIDFNFGSFDTLTPENKLRYTFWDTNPEVDPQFVDEKSSSYIDFRTDVNITRDIRVYVWDKSDNKNYCTIKINLIVEDNQPFHIISGKVFIDNSNTFDKGAIANLVDVFDKEDTLTTAVNTSGEYLFDGIKTGTYKVFVKKQLSMEASGITPFDFIKEQRKIFKISDFKDVYQYFAADINKDKRINVIDLCEMQRIMLGLTLSDFDNWRFGYKGQTFINKKTALQEGLQEEAIVNVKGPVNVANFRAIKLGDLNNSSFIFGADTIAMIKLGIMQKDLAATEGAFNKNRIKILFANPNIADTVIAGFKDRFVLPGEQVCVPLKIYNYDSISGFQLPISWDTTVLSFSHIKENSLGIGYYQKNNELLTLGFNCNAPIINDTILFNVCFDAIGEEGQYSDIDFKTNIGYEKGFFSIEKEIPMQTKSGRVYIGSGCIKQKDVFLDDKGQALLYAKDLYFGNDDVDVKIFGSDSIYFTCEDIGIQLLNISVNKGDSIELCKVLVKVKDNIKPVLKIKPHIDIQLDDYYYHLTPDMFDLGSYDNCSDISVKVYPEYIDCGSSNPLFVKLIAKDKSGNLNFAYSIVNVTYPFESSTLVCKDTVKLILEPEYGVRLTPEMLLDGDYYGCYNNYRVKIFDTIPYNLYKPGNVNNPVFLPGNYFVGVISIDNNSCWLTVKVMPFDKSVPYFSFQNKKIKKDENVCIGMFSENITGIDSFSFPISWDENILHFSYIDNLAETPLDNIDFDISPYNNEIYVSWYNRADTDIIFEGQKQLFDLCFETTGKENEKTEINFSSYKKKSKPMVYDSGEEIPSLFKSGEVDILMSPILCIDYMSVELDMNGQVVINGENLVKDSDDENLILVNNKKTIEFDCSDLGENIAEVDILYKNGIYDNCHVNIDVKDEIPPLVIPKTDIILLQNDNADSIALNQEMLLDTIIDNCGYTVKFSPSFLYCDDVGENDVYVTVIDQSGNISKVKVKVRVVCPQICGSDITVYLDYEDVSLKAGLLPVDSGEKVILINGEEEYSFNCDDIGKNIVELTKIDSVGDTIKCNTFFTVVDSIKPVPVCSQGITITLSNSGSAKISADLIDNGSYDNCSQVYFKVKRLSMKQEDNCMDFNGEDYPLSDTIDIGFDDDVNFCCADIDSTVLVDLRVFDKDPGFGTVSPESFTDENKLANHYKDCITEILVQDKFDWNNVSCLEEIDIEIAPQESIEILPSMVLENDVVCENSFGIALYDSTKSNKIQNDNILNVSDIGNTYFCKVTGKGYNNFCWTKVHVINAQDFLACATTVTGISLQGVKMWKNQYTEESGCVYLANISDGDTIIPYKNDDFSTAVDVADLVLIQQYLLGLEEISPYQILAANDNNDNKISASDILSLEKKIIDTGINEDPVWIFMDKNYHATTNNIYNCKNNIVFSDGRLNYDFYGIKRGDVDLSYGKNQEYDSTDLEIDDLVLFKGEKYHIDIYNSFDLKRIWGAQMSFKYNPDKIKIDLVKSEVLPNFITNNYFNDDGKLKLIWLEGLGKIFPVHTKLLTIEITAKDNGILHDNFELDTSFFNIISMYDVKKILALEWKDYINKVDSPDFHNKIEMYPQPAGNTVYVHWDRNEYGDVRYIINNLVGQKIKEAGLSNKINISNMKSGLYFIRFYNQDNKWLETQKLVVDR